MTEKKEDNKDTKEAPKKTLSLGKGTLSLKGGGAGGGPRPSAVAHSRSGAAVAVEVKRKRAATPAQPANEEKPNQTAEDPHLTNEEREARVKALRDAMGDGEKKKTTLPRRVTIEDRKKQEKVEKKETSEDARAKELEELKRIEEEERKAAEEQAKSVQLPPSFTPEHARKTRFVEEDNKESYRDRMKKAPPKPNPRSNNDRRGGRMTVSQALNRDYERDRGPSLAAQKRAREKARMAAMGTQEPAAKVVREVIVPEFITVQELANRMAEPGGEVVKALMKLGVMATITQSIDADTAELVIEEFGHKLKRVTDADVEIGLGGEDDKDEELIARPPVVTIMGHVDHGKTSLLDAMRQTNVVSGEAGGITQHIGAYQIELPEKGKITFLDTPGHAAFTEMRARGANVTDVVVIVVSAEDSIMPQTIEAINHAKAAEVPIIIAVNKIDLPAANPEKTKQDLLQHEVVVEDMGGDTLCIEVSAKKGTNLDKLEEAILLQSEILELKANPNRPAEGAVVESKLEKGRGPVATVLIQRGTIRVGDVFVAGAEFGKVRALINDRGEQIEEAIPGQPVEVLGLNGVPESGDMLNVTPDESKAREISEYRQRKRREAQAAQAVKGRTTMDDLLAQREAGEKTSLPVIIKADVHGSIEAIAGSFEKMMEDNEDIEVQILHTGVGGITESDVTLSKASGAAIIGFNVRANAQARDLAQRENIELRYYNVIYDVIDDAKAVLSGMLSPTQREEYLGQAQIQEVFNITKVGKIAGCMVSIGMVKRGAKVRLLRDDVVIHEGMLKTLKRFKDEVKEVKEGTECGMAFENYDDLKENDVIECYEVIEEARSVA